MSDLRTAAEQALEALEIGYECAQVEAAQFHAAMAGYRPERHAAMDADVAKIAKAITALRAALAQQAEPSRTQRMRDAGYLKCELAYKAGGEEMKLRAFLHGFIDGLALLPLWRWLRSKT